MRNLHLQLQPHFLFNALNAISSKVYEDAAAADAMIARLADLLRYALRTSGGQEVPLGVELDALDDYLALLDARFGENLVCVRDVAAGARDAFVPSLVLQPVVENAVRHGRLAREGRGRITLRARRDGEMLRLEVEDDGPGLPSGADSPGAPAATPGHGGMTNERVGLASTVERILMRVLIVDDEKPARTKLRRLLEAERDVAIVGEAANGIDAVACIRADAPDLVFLDIQMPGLDGFGVIDEIGLDRMPYVVFATAYDEHALRAFGARGRLSASTHRDHPDRGGLRARRSVAGRRFTIAHLADRTIGGGGEWRRNDCRCDTFERLCD
ncbi:MAG TPA: histidine kinase [Vicinamibacterales bacterium]|nr:histidine kinase [Vicinamibacterales bacterium]